MPKRTYVVPVKYIFKGKYKVEAESRQEAEEKVKDSCWMTSSGYGSTLSCEEIDWDFPMHPEKQIMRRR
jgi:hypothetical protein